MDHFKDYVVVSELYVKYPNFRFDAWLKKKRSLQYIQSLESSLNPEFNQELFDKAIEKRSKVTVNSLMEAGCKSVYAKKGKYGYILINRFIYDHIIISLDPEYALKMIQAITKKHSSEYLLEKFSEGVNNG
jgi:hypothetical protein